MAANPVNLAEEVAQVHAGMREKRAKRALTPAILRRYRQASGVTRAVQHALHVARLNTEDVENELKTYDEVLVNEMEDVHTIVALNELAAWTPLVFIPMEKLEQEEGRQMTLRLRERQLMVYPQVPQQ